MAAVVFCGSCHYGCHIALIFGGHWLSGTVHHCGGSHGGIGGHEHAVAGQGYKRSRRCGVVVHPCHGGQCLPQQETADGVGGIESTAISIQLHDY